MPVAYKVGLVAIEQSRTHAQAALISNGLVFQPGGRQVRNGEPRDASQQGTSR